MEPIPTQKKISAAKESKKMDHRFSKEWSLSREEVDWRWKNKDWGGGLFFELQINDGIEAPTKKVTSLIKIHNYRGGPEVVENP